MLKAKRIARFLLSLYFVMMGHMMFAHHHFEGCEHGDAIVNHGHEDMEHHGHDCHHHDNSKPEKEDSNLLDELSELFHIHFCTGDSELFTSANQKTDIKPVSFDSDFLHSEVQTLIFSVDVTHVDLITPDEQTHAPPVSVHRLRGPPVV